MEKKSFIIPKKSLGQHFLVNPRILDKIVAAAEVGKDDIVVEIGPGTGNLTQKIAEKAKRVIAVEKDQRLIKSLKEKFKGANVEIIESDVLKLKIETLIENLKLPGLRSRSCFGGVGKIENYKIVGNIPYYITSNFLRKIFEGWPKPKLVILTIQKEVAQRIIAKPPHMNLLAVSVQVFADTSILCYITKNSFRPRPKVDSAIIKLTPKVNLPIDDIEKFFKIVRAGFSQKRKLLISNLAGKLNLPRKKLEKIFEKLNLNPKTRAQELTINDWIKIMKNI